MATKRGMSSSQPEMSTKRPTTPCQPSSPKVMKIDRMVQSIEEAVENIDIVVRATCFSSAKQEHREVTTGLEKVRRLLKCLHLKTKDTAKDVRNDTLVLMQQMRTMTASKFVLEQKNVQLREEVKDLKMKLECLCGNVDDDFNDYNNEGKGAGSSTKANPPDASASPTINPANPVI